MSDPSEDDADRRGNDTPDDASTDATVSGASDEATPADTASYATDSAVDDSSSTDSAPISPETDATASELTDSDGGDPADTSPSPLRTVGAAFGLGIMGVAGLVAISIIVSGLFLLAEPLIGELSFAVTALTPTVLGQFGGFVGGGLLYLYWRGFDLDDVLSYVGVRRPTLVESVIGLVGPIAVLITALSLGSLVLLVGAEPAQNEGAQLALENPAILPIMILVMLLVVGPAEEFLFRGVIQSRARETFSAAPAIVLAAAVFAPLHVVSLTGGVTAMLITVSLLFVPSLLFGAVYEYTDNLVVVAVMHGIYNSLLLTLGYIAITYGGELEGAAADGTTALLLAL